MFHVVRKPRFAIEYRGKAPIDDVTNTGVIQSTHKQQEEFILRREGKSASIRNCAPEKSDNQALCLRQSFIQLAAIFSTATRVVRLAAAFAADDRRDLLDDFSGLDFRREFRRDRRNQHHALAARSAAQNNHAFETALQ